MMPFQGSLQWFPVPTAEASKALASTALMMFHFPKMLVFQLFSCFPRAWRQKGSNNILPRRFATQQVKALGHAKLSRPRTCSTSLSLFESSKYYFIYFFEFQVSVFKALLKRGCQAQSLAFYCKEDDEREARSEARPCEAPHEILFSAAEVVLEMDGNLHVN